MAVARVAAVVTIVVPIVWIGGSPFRVVISAARIATVSVTLASWCAAPFPHTDKSVAGHVRKVRIDGAARGGVRVNFSRVSLIQVPPHVGIILGNILCTAWWFGRMPLVLTAATTSHVATVS